MRIGIYTIYDAYNYGSFLQAFALQEFLKGKGHEVTIVKCPSSLKSIILRKYLAKNFSRQILKIKRLWAYKKGWRILNIKKFNNCDNFDVAIIGSDEVWNIENNSFVHHKQFYGLNCKATINLVYAPSLGYSTIKSYDQFPILKDSIKHNIHKFGTRDLFSKHFLYEIGVTDVEDICDPTILLYRDWKKYELPLSGINSPYLIYYSYNGDTPYINYIKKFAAEKGLEIIVPGFNYGWCDKSLIVSPLQFLTLMRNAEYVITSTFHGTVFSTLYHKKLIAVNPASKVEDYLSQLGLLKVAQDGFDYKQFKGMLEQEINYNLINQKFFSWKMNSENFLALNL